MKDQYSMDLFSLSNFDFVSSNCNVDFNNDMVIFFYIYVLSS